MLGFLVLLLALAHGPQVVLSKFKSITFSSIEQCGPFNVTFAQGAMPSASPLSLTVLPFNSVPISIPIPSSSWDDHASTGAYITFLPLPAGATFIASLDDSAGNSTGAVSDVIRVQSSSNTSCLPASPSQPADFFAIGGGFSQCEPFSLQWNSSVTSQPPTIRAFIPKGPSFHVQQLPGGGNGYASYAFNASRGQEVAFLINDGQGNKRVLDLFTIGGDSSSSTECLLDSGKQHRSNRNLSKGVTIAISVVASVAVTALLITVAFYVVRERRRRAAMWGEKPPAIPPKPTNRPDSPTIPSSPPPKPAILRPFMLQQAPCERYLTNPPYVTEDFPPRRVSLLTRHGGTLESGGFLDVQFEDNPRRLTPLTPSFHQRASRPDDPHIQSVSSLDIERILEDATASDDSHDTRSFRAPHASSPLNEHTSFSPRLSPKSAEGLDVPLSATPFGRFSGLSMDLNELGGTPTGSGLSFGVVTPVQAGVVPDKRGDYTSEKGSISSRPLRMVAAARGRTKSDDSTVRSMMQGR